jgi:hypothetical protein
MRSSPFQFSPATVPNRYVLQQWFSYTPEPAARTLATGLANRTFPFIRYDLGDQVNWLLNPCACGSAFARVADFGGRRDDDFRYEAATIPASVFRHVLGTDPHVSEYQVHQTVRGADVLAVGSPDVEALTSSVVAALRRRGLPDPEVNIRVVEGLQRTTQPASCNASLRSARPRGQKQVRRAPILSHA